MTRRVPTPEVHLVTGDRGAGKTTFCRRFVAAVQAKRPGLAVAGILCPKVFVAGVEAAIEAVDLASGERRHLASLRESATPAGGPSTIRWQFDAAALAWGDAVLRSATPCDLLVVDELGPLELERGEGWAGGLEAVDGAAYRAAFIVVRPELLEPARRRWPGARPLPVAGVEEVDALVGRVVRDLLG